VGRFRIMEWFHRLDTVKKIPIIVITGSEDPQGQGTRHEHGCGGVFQKPLEHDYLLKVIRATLGRSGK
jgi:DNA-binding response OmpR family regulator